MIYLVGITGVGKTAIGRALAERLNYAFIDLDELIEIRESQTVTELFKRGEAHFRNCESAALMALPRRPRTVVATGGGVVTRPQNIAFMRQTGTVVFLYRPLKGILQSLDVAQRPLLKAQPKRLYELYRARRSAYRRAAHHRISARRCRRAVQRIAEVCNEDIGY